ncbi:type I restriction enzyme HsdR N-terminal domain-containing protein [Thiovibrio frasassiensis]|uniref:Type I restriction enzyme HsdR N-terminal domain-containing protein n=1 Tax=Thiovibrio frasassiensis TaxID=2984131 RepID=A0A9X4MGI1_9BACT|nr:type I restriction enzyme HsdR N-terminal domain-containing protein [Thiovibrio frasassiensis]MDG4475480.1 type I restriction enzyme HsdR N-terminal domain-containing protein [Thiovibrio frasassiensis]
MADIPSHHMIYGNLDDFITGETLVDTDDERYRQKLARLLVEERGFAKGEVEMRRRIETLFAHQFVVSKIDIVVRLEGRRVMVVRYGPGSLVTRERPAIAAARVLEESQLIPLAVVSNGEDGELLDTRTGKVLGTGLGAIPTRESLVTMLPSLDFTPVPPERREPELRILNAFDIEVCCAGGPCALPGAKEG